MTSILTHPITPRGHALGMRPSAPDLRDHQMRIAAVEVPAAVSLEINAPPVMDQGELGSCTAHGILGAYRTVLRTAKRPDLDLSRLMLYYDERVKEHTVTSDAGAEIADGLQSLRTQGVAPEDEWPYVPARFAVKPPAQCYVDDAAHRIASYARVPQTLIALKQALAQGFPIIIGIAVYASFESDAVATTGKVPMPKRQEALLGGHCLYVIGYDDKLGGFRVRNSWGATWGVGGDCLVPYAYLTSDTLCSDLWVIETLPA